MFSYISKDIVELNIKSPEDYQKLIKFNDKHYSKDVGIILEKSGGIKSLDKIVFVVYDGIVSQTQKSNTQYLQLVANNQFYLLVQFRYIKLKYRKPQHKLTGIFSDTWQPET